MFKYHTKRIMKKQLLIKLVPTLIIFFLIFTIFMPTIAYAKDDAIEGQTNEKNVKFSASINGQTSAKIDLDSKGILNIKLSVQNVGYLKSTAITFENSNFELSDVEKNSYINSINGNVVILNHVNAGQEANINLQILFPKSNQFNKNAIKSNTNVVLDAIYINEKGKEKNVKKKLELKIEWDKKEAEATISQKLVRNIKYNDKTMLSFEVTDGIKDNVVPVTEKKINVTVPKLGSKEPSTTIVTLNGKDIKKVDTITEEDIDSKSNIKIIKKEAKVSEIVDTASERENKKNDSNDKKTEQVSEKSAQENMTKNTTSKSEENIVENTAQNTTSQEQNSTNENTLTDLNTITKNENQQNKNIIDVEQKINDDSSVDSNEVTIQEATTNNNTIDYSYSNGVLTINKKDGPDENGLMSWNSTDTFLVTYIYDIQTQEKTLEQDASTSINTVFHNTISATANEKIFDIQKDFGNILELSTSIPEYLSKGYIYTNLNNGNNKLETDFTQSYNINIGFKDFTDKIELKENSLEFDDADENGYAVKIADMSNLIKTNKITIDRDNFVKLFGEGGSIKVYDASGTELGTLNKDTNELNLNKQILVNFQISKPQAEGNLIINLNKSIIGDLGLSKEQIDKCNYLLEYTEIKGKNIEDTSKEIEISDKNLVSIIKLKNPTSTVELSTSTDTLSTVIENKDVTINAVLKTNSINDSLYKNPVIKFTLPNEVTSINVKDARAFYDEEEAFKSNYINVNGKEITIGLEGEQKKYSKSLISDGTLIRIVADISLDKLAPSNDEAKLKLDFSNEETGETGHAELPMKVSAPVGFIMTNEMTDGMSNVSAYNTSVEPLVVKDNSTEEQNLKITANLINNMGSDVNGVTILGVLPYQGNKATDNTDLNSNMTAILSSGINLSGLDEATIYYSNDENANINSNNWSTNATTDTKKFKIVSQTPIKNKSLVTFSYDLKLPKALQYDLQGTEDYTLFYNQNVEEGNKLNYVISQPISFKTKATPKVIMEVSAYDTNEGIEIANNGNVKKGEYVTYKVKVINNGDETAQNVIVKAKYPSQIYNVSYSEADDLNNDISEYATDLIDSNTAIIGNISAKESKTIEFNSMVSGLDISDQNEQKENKQYSISFNLTSDNMDSSNAIFTNQITENQYSIKVTDNQVKDSLTKGDRLTFRIAYQNMEKEDLSNAKIKLNLGEGLKFKEIVGQKAPLTSENTNEIIKIGEDGNNETYETVDAQYDEKQNIVTIIPNKNSNKNYVDFETEVTSETKVTSNVYATISGDDSNNEVKSNTLSIKIADITKNGIKVKQSISTATPNISDTDKFAVYCDIENESGAEQEIKIQEKIPDGLRVENYILTVNGINNSMNDSSNIDEDFTLEDNGKARLTINLYSDPIANGNTETYNFIPQIESTNNKSINVETFPIVITGTKIENEIKTTNSQDNIGEQAEEETTTKQEELDSSDRYTISGTLFLDANKNGQLDLNEPNISNAEVMLYDNNLNHFVLGNDGNNLTAITDDNGCYAFVGIEKGNYNVVADYDTDNYQITTYKANGVDEQLNSDFVDATVDNKNVASTDTIYVNSNKYNENLGLIEKNVFDLLLCYNVEKITVQNPVNGNKEYQYNDNIAKVELDTPNIDKNVVLVKYKITIENEGNVEGFAKSIDVSIPEGFMFNSSLNPTWYKKDGKLHNISLANTTIYPQQAQELTLILTKHMTGENVGIFNSVAEIEESDNRYALKDIDSETGNRKDGEDDQDSTDVLILMNAGKVRVHIVSLTLLIWVLIILTVWFIQKFILQKKMDKYDKWKGESIL